MDSLTKTFQATNGAMLHDAGPTMNSKLYSLASTIFLVVAGLFLVVWVTKSACRRPFVESEKIRAFDLAFGLGADYA